LSREDGQRLSAMCEGVGRALNGLITRSAAKLPDPEWRTTNEQRLNTNV
jgi:hypothetical protein